MFSSIPYISLTLTDIEYFESERGCMIELRLKQLIDAKCDKFAFNLSQRAIRATKSCNDERLLLHTINYSQYFFILENYLSLLYKYKQLDKVKQELEKLDFEEAHSFLQKCLTTMQKNEKFIAYKKKTSQNNPIGSGAAQIEAPNPSRLHKYHICVCEYALQLILVRSLSEEYDQTRTEKMGQLLGVWIRKYQREKNFAERFHKLVQNARSNYQIYECCEVLYKRVSFMQLLFLVQIH